MATAAAAAAPRTARATSATRGYSRAEIRGRVEQRRRQVGGWFLQGYSQCAIASALGVTEALISLDLKRMGLKPKVERNLPPLPKMCA